MEIMSKNTPDEITTDFYGVDFLPGDKVAINYMGEIRIGYILEIKRNEWFKLRGGINGKTWWTLKFEMKVKQLDGTVSTVKNIRSFIRI